MQWQKSTCVFAAALALGIAPLCAHAQQTDPRPVNPASSMQPESAGKSDGFNRRPVPSARGVAGGYDSPADDRSQARPDEHMLASVEDYGVGSLEAARDRFDPSVAFTQGGQTGYPGSGGPTGLASMTIAGGRADFLRTWNRYQLFAIYNGGETLYHPQILQNLAYHNFDIGQELSWNRWLLRVRYNFLASPQADFGGQGVGGPGMWGAAAVNPGDLLPPVIGINFAPSETILTGQTMRLRHTALAEVDYAWSRRSRLTLAGSYGLLQFNLPGYLNSRGFVGQAGYEYSLDPKDTIGVLGAYGKTNFDGRSIFTDSSLAELTFGRKITGRLAFQFAAGPQQIRLLNAAPGGLRLWTWAMHDALTYQGRRTGLSLSYAHGLTGGSGVLFGAQSQIITVTLNRRLTRFWTASFTSGYARNSGLVQPGGVLLNYNTWFTGANVGRQLSRHLNVNFNYGVERQTSTAACPVAACLNNAYQHTFGMTLRWHLLPAE